jgi:hypothetical protein
MKTEDFAIDRKSVKIIRAKSPSNALNSNEDISPLPMESPLKPA